MVFFGVEGKYTSLVSKESLFLVKKKKCSILCLPRNAKCLVFWPKGRSIWGRRRLLELSVNLRERKTCIFAWGVGVLQEASNKFWFYLFVLDLCIVHKLRRICKSWISVTKWENKESYMYVRAKKKKSFFIRETHTKWFFFLQFYLRRVFFIFFCKVLRSLRIIKSKEQF